MDSFGFSSQIIRTNHSAHERDKNSFFFFQRQIMRKKDSFYQKSSFKIGTSDKVVRLFVLCRKKVLC